MFKIMTDIFSFFLCSTIIFVRNLLGAWDSGNNLQAPRKPEIFLRLQNQGRAIISNCIE